VQWASAVNKKDFEERAELAGSSKAFISPWPGKKNYLEKGDQNCDGCPTGPGGINNEVRVGNQPESDKSRRQKVTSQRGSGGWPR